MSTQGELIHGVLHYPCEVCGEMTPNFITDGAETEPTFKDGKPYMGIESRDTHYLCKKHTRQPKVEEFFKSKYHRVAWLLKQPGYVAEKNETELELLRKSAQEGLQKGVLTPEEMP